MEQEVGKDRPLDSYKEAADKFISFFKVATILSLLIGGWGLFNYSVKEGVPFPADVPAMILMVGVVGSGLALAVTVIMFFPRLGVEGILGEEYLWLFPKNKYRGKIFMGYIGVPIFIFFMIFLFDVAIDSPMEKMAIGLLSGVGLTVALVSICVTAFCGHKKGERLKAIMLGSMLAFMVMSWSLLVLVLMVRLLDWLKADNNEFMAWFLLVSLPVVILVVLYKMMIPQEKDTGKIWKTLMVIVIAAPILHPDLAGYMAGRSLELIKGGGGYKTSYALREKYCNGAYEGLCEKGTNKTVELEAMLDVGGRIYVRIPDDNSSVYAIPERAIIEQKI